MPDTSPAKAPSKPSPRVRIRSALLVIVALALYALLVDAAVETWQSLSPVRWWVVLPVAAFVSFSTWLLGQHRSSRPSAATAIWFSFLVFLAILAITAGMPGGLTQGLTLASMPTSTVLSIATIGLIAFAMVSLLAASPLNVPMRVVAALAGCYGMAGFLSGLVWRRSYVEMLHGDSLWSALPRYLQGAFVGALVVVPLALVVEVGVALARVKVRGRLHRIVAFALGVLIAYSAITAQ